MDSNAPGQFLGYVIQFPRALLHLLNTGPGDEVYIEVFGDVATSYEDGSLKTEEDKSSIVSNPLTDKSTDLWKTFFNWIKALNDEKLVLEKTQFLLFTNQKGREAIVENFSNAKSLEEAQKAVKSAKAKLQDIDKAHPIWEYYNYVVNENEASLLKLILKFELEIADDYSYKSIEEILVRKHVGKYQIEFIIQKLSGWLQRKVIEQISERKHARVTWEEFNKEFLIFFAKSRQLELIDFTLQIPIDANVIDKERKEQPNYLKQLSAIEIVDESEIIEAVTDFIRAGVNRDKWIEDELIDEDSAKDFEDKLHQYWKNKKQSLLVTESHRTASQVGKLLYYDCRARQELIRNMSPPARTIAGTYHALANTPILGWHPTWDKSFKA